MKKLVCLTLLLGIVSLGFAQKAKQKSPLQSPSQSALQSMVDTELAFAKMSAEQGTRPAFMAFIADDGILFRPRAVKGKQWMTENPVPSSAKRPLLSWYPTVADIARAGDMAYTTGPWEYKGDLGYTYGTYRVTSKDSSQKVLESGNYYRVWKKQGNKWLVVADLLDPVAEEKKN